ncbi:MAG: efflux RND transporter periplasmic adaptor subunit [Saprospiraceae bacterium]|nr:efflux RND transporter periplasmic adaptor subunit [Saprospiraceae bacterium]
MKNINSSLISSLLLALIFSACGGKQAVDKKTQLANLKTQQATLNSQISTLEKELNASDTTKKVKVKFISTMAATPSVFNHFIELQGAVSADNEYFLNAKVAGAIKSVSVGVGSRVSAGQIVAEIDDDILQNQMDELLKRYELAKDVFEKQESLWKQNIDSEVQYLSAKNNKEALEKGMATLTKSREYYKIVAPIAGIVDETMTLKVGQVVAPGVPLAKIVNFSKLKFKAEVPESYVGKVRTGNNVVVNFPDLKKDVSGKVSYIGSSVNPMNRTFRVEVPLRANEANVLPNMLGILKLSDYSNANAFVIPINILKKDLDGSDFVLIEEAGRAKKVFIKIGQYFGDTAEILSGLKSGDRLITIGYEDLSEGDAVQVQ